MKLEEFLISIKDLAERNGLSEPFIVGGVARDRILGRVGEKTEIRDIDLTTGDFDSHKLAFLLSKEYPESVYREYDDGHVSLDMLGIHLDFSSHFVIPGIENELAKMGITDLSEMKKEIYSRDFTMNTILERLDFSETFDITKQGIGDINAGLIRCPIDPDITIGIDARRILRAIKYSLKFDFTIESKLKEAMLKHRESVANLPPKFVNSKMDEIVRIDADKGLDLLIEFKLLSLLPLSKMMNQLLIQKRKVLHSLSSNRISSRVKVAAPVFDFRPILLQITTLHNVVENAKKETDAAKKNALLSNVGQMLTNLRKEMDKVRPTTVMANEDHKTPEFWRKNLDYGERKEATIRGDCGKKCPYGLSIPYACKTVGNTIHRMEPIENKEEELKEKYEKANKIVYSYCKEKSACPYADQILSDKFHKVDCNFGDTGQGMKSPNLQGSPLYPSTFNSLSLTGIYGYPLGYYTDNSAARNMFFGLFSYLGREEYLGLTKIAGDIGLAMKLIGTKIK